MKTIEMVFDVDGKVEIATKGFQGKSCEEASKFMEEIGEKTGEKKTAEWFQKPVVRLNQR